MARVRWFLIVAGVLVLMIFSLSNTEKVPIGMPFVFHADIPLSMLLVIAGLIGFMVGALWTAWMLRRKKTNPEKSGGTGSVNEATSQVDEPL